MKRYSPLMGGIVAIIIVFVLWDKVSAREILSAKTWQGENPHMLLWGGASFVVMLAAKSWRFFLFYQKAVRKKVDFGEKVELFRLFCFGYSLSYFLAGAGVLAKVALLKKNYQVKAMTSISLIVAEKIFSLAVVLPTTLYAGMYYSRIMHRDDWPNQAMFYHLWLMFFLVASAILGIFLSKKMIFWCFFAAKYLPKHWKNLKKWIKKSIIYSNIGFSLTKKPISLLFCLALTVTIWLGEAGIFYSFFHFHGVKLTFWQSIVFFFVVFAHTILPITGSILTFELGFWHAAKLFPQLFHHEKSILPMAIFVHTGLCTLYLTMLIITAILSAKKKRRQREVNLQGNSL